ARAARPLRLCPGWPAAGRCLALRPLVRHGDGATLACGRCHRAASAPAALTALASLTALALAGLPDTTSGRPGCRQEPGGNDGMFSHIMIGTNDLDRAKKFYDALLGTLGVPEGRVDRHRIFWRTKTGTFSVSKPIDGKAATFANGGTIGFSADSVDAA